MYTKTIISFFVFLFAFSSLFSQNKSGDIWYFGRYAGLDFSSGTATVIHNSAMNNAEGSAVACDSVTGSLLFYSNGATIWDSTHQIMQNGQGLKGSLSNAMAALIIPHPGHPQKYLMFTMDDDTGPDGLQYSEIDMSLNNGRGAVSSAKKNIQVYGSGLSEQLLGVKHENNRDYWIVVHKWNSREVWAYLVDTTGVNTVPVVSTIGSLFTGVVGRTHGTAKASPNGRLIMWHINLLEELFQFDPSNGQVTGSVLLNNQVVGNTYLRQGCSFSANGCLLYTSYRTQRTIYQYDVSSFDSTAILGSKTLVGQMPSGQEVGAMSLAPDGKIYISKDYNEPYLASISFPNVSGTGCMYINNALLLTPGNNGYGIVNFVDNIFSQSAPASFADFSIQNFCAGDTIFFTDQSSYPPDSWTWNFWNPQGGSLGSQTGPMVNRIFTDTGLHRIQLIAEAGCVIDTVEKWIRMEGGPESNLGPDTIFCDTKPPLGILNPGVQGATYLWHNGSTAPTFVVNSPGTYWVQIATACDTITDSITVYAMLPPKASFTSNDSFLTVKFSDASLSPTNWFWNFGDGNTSSLQHPQHTYTNFGEYIVCLQVWNECGADTICDTLNIRVDPIEDLLELGLKWEIDYVGKKIVLINKSYLSTQFSLINLNGQELERGMLAPQSNREMLFSHLPKGMYILRFGDGEKQAFLKWMNY